MATQYIVGKASYPVCAATGCWMLVDKWNIECSEALLDGLQGVVSSGTVLVMTVHGHAQCWPFQVDKVNKGHVLAEIIEDPRFNVVHHVENKLNLFSKTWVESPCWAVIIVLLERWDRDCSSVGWGDLILGRCMWSTWHTRHHSHRHCRIVLSVPGFA
jgi:hypothetical protein